MSKKLTPWFPPEVKPVRKGVYPTEFDCINGPVAGYSFWFAPGWSGQRKTPKDAMDFTHRADGIQHKRWRGLASDPKGKA